MMGIPTRQMATSFTTLRRIWLGRRTRRVVLIRYGGLKRWDRREDPYKNLVEHGGVLGLVYDCT